MPVASPPPPTGITTVSRSGRSSRISSPIVPLPAITASSATGCTNIPSSALDPAGHDRLPPIVVRQLDHLPTEPLDRRELGLRRVLGHRDRRRQPELARDPGHPLSHVPGAGGQQAARSLLGRGGADRVGGAADLERVDRLQRLELAVDLGRRRQLVDAASGPAASEPRCRRSASGPARSRPGRSQLHPCPEHRRSCAVRTASVAAARSSTPMPSERNSVSPSAGVRPSAAPASTSPSSARMCRSPSITPSSTASRNSSASLRTDSRLSQNSAAAATVSSSSSRRRQGARADRVDVRVVAQPRVLEHRNA